MNAYKYYPKKRVTQEGDEISNLRRNYTVNGSLICIFKSCLTIYLKFEYNVIHQSTYTNLFILVFLRCYILAII